MININNKEHVKALQELMIKCGYDLGKWGADGDFGKTSKKAFNEMIKDVNNSDDKFTLSSEERIKFIINGCKKEGFTDKQISYVLATVKRETNNTFEPVIEAYWLSEDWRRKNLKYYPYHGRGYVQITWKSNYEKFSKILNMDLVNNPDLVLKPNVSLFILMYGFKHGTFTGKKISDYVNENKTDYYNCRRCINGVDHAREIANNAEYYYNKYFK